VHRIDTDTREEDKHGSGKDGFTGGDPQAAIAPTDLSPDWCDAVQEEIAHVVEEAGLALSKADHDQLLEAIRIHAQAKIVEGYRLSNVQLFTANGTWTRPAGVRAVRAFAVGAGGGGGGAASSGNRAAAGGGGGGGMAWKWITNPAASVSVTVGTGGAGGAAGANNGSNGGSSWFGFGEVQGNGGAFGSGATQGTTPLIRAGGEGGLASGGDVNTQGSQGGYGLRVDGSTSAPGHGGASPLSGGVGGFIGGFGSGHEGSSPGGGGSGAHASGSDVAGSDGADGIVIVEEYI
jgi:hypothetical protein